MITLDVDRLLARLAAEPAPLVLFGAGDLGKLTLHALRKRHLSVTAFVDGNPGKVGTECLGLPVLGLDALGGLPANAHVFVCSNYLRTMPASLSRLAFLNVYSCATLLEQTDLSDVDFMQPLDVQRKVALHLAEFRKADASLLLKYVDIVITERCSMKCRDCANLMQYYAAPRHVDCADLLASVDAIVAAVDGISELRVLGGEPFVNKEMHTVVNHVVACPTVGRVVVYTNATIVPTGANLSCLQHAKVLVDITNYGVHSRNYEALLACLREHRINFLTKIPVWTDSGRIQRVERTPAELADVFANCCVNDVLTLLHGKLYRCPFSANATNLGAVPERASEVVDVCHEDSRDGLRAAVRSLYTKATPLAACDYCNGRDYRTPRIEAGLQVRRPIPLQLAPQ